MDPEEFALVVEFVDCRTKLRRQFRAISPSIYAGVLAMQQKPRGTGNEGSTVYVQLEI